VIVAISSPVSLERVRRFTLITLVCLFLLLAGAAAYQLLLANRGVERFPGPQLGTPLPSATATA
jgi:hypothetical protein